MNKSTTHHLYQSTAPHSLTAPSHTHPSHAAPPPQMRTSTPNNQTNDIHATSPVANTIYSLLPILCVLSPHYIHSKTSYHPLFYCILLCEYCLLSANIVSTGASMCPSQPICSVCGGSCYKCRLA